MTKVETDTARERLKSHSFVVEVRATSSYRAVLVRVWPEPSKLPVPTAHIDQVKRLIEVAGFRTLGHDGGVHCIVPYERVDQFIEVLNAANAALRISG